MIPNTEQVETAQAESAEPKVTKSARASKKGANVASKKGKPGKKATSAKKAPKARKGEKKGGSARDGSKAATILELLKRPGGATAKELMKASGWQAHSVTPPSLGSWPGALPLRAQKPVVERACCAPQAFAVDYEGADAFRLPSWIRRSSAHQSESAKHKPATSGFPASSSASIAAISRWQRAIHTDSLPRSLATSS